MVKNLTINKPTTSNLYYKLVYNQVGFPIFAGIERFAHLLIDGGARVDLDKLKINRISDSFRKNLLQRMQNPPSLLELSRRSLSRHFGPLYRDWTVQSRDDVPKALHPFMMFEQ